MVAICCPCFDASPWLSRLGGADVAAGPIFFSLIYRPWRSDLTFDTNDIVFQTPDMILSHLNADTDHHNSGLLTGVLNVVARLALMCDSSDGWGCEWRICHVWLFSIVLRECSSVFKARRWAEPMSDRLPLALFGAIWSTDTFGWCAFGCHHPHWRIRNIGTPLVVMLGTRRSIHQCSVWVVETYIFLNPYFPAGPRYYLTHALLLERCCWRSDLRRRIWQARLYLKHVSSCFSGKKQN